MSESKSNTFSFAEFLSPAGEYRLSNVALDIPNPATFDFSAKLHGPSGAPVQARAWISNQTDGTLAEAVSQRKIAGDSVKLSVRLNSDKVPDQAFIRIESAPQNSQHVMGTRLGTSA